MTSDSYCGTDLQESFSLIKINVNKNAVSYAYILNEGHCWSLLTIKYFVIIVIINIFIIIINIIGITYNNVKNL